MRKDGDEINVMLIFTYVYILCEWSHVTRSGSCAVCMHKDDNENNVMLIFIYIYIYMWIKSRHMI